MSIGLRIGNGLALAFGASLLILGPDTTFVTPDGPTTVTKSPTLAGLVPLGIGVAAAWAVVTRRTRAFWLAAALAIAAAVLLLFSYSLQLAPIAAFLVLAAAVRTTTARGKSSGRPPMRQTVRGGGTYSSLASESAPPAGRLPEGRREP